MRSCHSAGQNLTEAGPVNQLQVRYQLPGQLLVRLVVLWVVTMVGGQYHLFHQYQSFYHYLENVTNKMFVGRECVHYKTKLVKKETNLTCILHLRLKFVYCEY